jgi:hypothetical protein
MWEQEEFQFNDYFELKVYLARFILKANVKTKGSPTLHKTN